MKWNKISIGDLGEVITGNTPLTTDREFYGGPYPFIKPTDMDIDRRHVTKWEENYSEKAFKKYKNAYIPPGSTGVVTIGTVGEKIFQADQYCFTNQSVNVVIPDRSKYDPDFVYYLLKFSLPKVSRANPGTASGRHHVSKSNFCSIKIHVPSQKEVQRKIGTILSAYDDLIENNLKRIKLLEELAQRTYGEWFVKFRVRGEKLKVNKETGLPEGWIKKTLGDMIEVGRGSSPRPIADQRYFEGGNIPWLKIADATASHIFIHKTREHVNDLGASFSRKLKPGSLIVAASGTLGFPMFLSVEACIHDGWIYFSDFNEDLKEYFYFSFIGLKQYFESISYGAAIQNINTGIVKASPFILPPKKILAAFREISRPVLKSIEIAQKENILLKEARDILLPRLMSGVIDVEEFDHEPLAMAAEPVATYQTKHRAKSLTQK